MRSQKLTVVGHVLEGLIPYTESNLLLTFNPGKFYAELEKKTSSSRNTLAATMSRAKRNKLLRIDSEGMPRLTWRGKSKIGAAFGDILHEQRLVVIFDIPESHKAGRRELRIYLISQGFVYVQKSVWAGKRNITNELIEVLAELQLGSYVKIFLAETIYS